MTGKKAVAVAIDTALTQPKVPNLGRIEHMRRLKFPAVNCELEHSMNIMSMK